jgi:hypothetical protein
MSKRRVAVGVLAALLLSIPVIAQPPGKPAADPAIAAVSADAFFFASVKVSKLWDSPAAKPLRDWVASQKAGSFDRALGLQPAELDRLTLFAATADPEAGGAPLILVTTRQKYSEEKVLKAMNGGTTPTGRVQASDRAFEIEGGAFRWVVFLDNRTILYVPCDLDHRSIAPKLLARLRAPKPDGPLASALAIAANHDLMVSVDVRQLDDIAREFKLDSDKQFAPYLGLLKAKTATLTADFDKSARVQFTLAFPDADSAKRNAPVLENGMKALAALLTEVGADSSADPALRVLATWATTVVKNAKVTTTGTNVVATADAPFADDMTKLVAVLPKQLLSTRNERLAINNLKQLAIAMHNIHDVYGHCTSDVMPGGGAKPLAMSWRVQILPYIEQDNLYKQLDMTKPWDDPANLKLLEGFEMPKVFEFPGRAAPKGHTYFRIFKMPKDAKGTERPFLKEGERGPRLTDITDGTSNTLMIVEAGEAVPWYKPDVLAYDGKLPLPQLGDPNTERFLAALGDGSVRSFRSRVLGEKTIRGLITINGGEVFELPR